MDWPGNEPSLAQCFRCVNIVKAGTCLAIGRPRSKPGALMQGCTNPGRQIARLTKFYAVLLNICGSSVRNLLSLFWLLEFGGGFYSFGKYVDSCLNACLKGVTPSPNSPETLICVHKKKTQNHNERFYAQLCFTETMTRC